MPRDLLPGPQRLNPLLRPSRGLGLVEKAGRRDLTRPATFGIVCWHLHNPLFLLSNSIVLITAHVSK